MNICNGLPPEMAGITKSHEIRQVAPSTAQGRQPPVLLLVMLALLPDCAAAAPCKHQAARPIATQPRHRLSALRIVDLPMSFTASTRRLIQRVDCCVAAHKPDDRALNRRI